MNSRIAETTRLRDLENLARIRIDDEIEIALAIADLDIRQAVPLLRQREQALREEMQTRRPDRQLVGFRPEETSLDADPVAEVQQLEDPKIQLGHRVLTDVDLNARETVRNHQEVGFAERADREHAAARDRFRPARLELIVRGGGMRLHQRSHGVLAMEAAGIRGDAQPLELAQIRSTLLFLLFLRRHSLVSRFASGLFSSGCRPACH